MTHSKINQELPKQTKENTIILSDEAGCYLDALIQCKTVFHRMAPLCDTMEDNIGVLSILPGYDKEIVSRLQSVLSELQNQINDGHWRIADTGLQL